MSPTPLRDAPQRAGQTRRRSELHHDPAALARSGSTPKVREAQEVKADLRLLVIPHIRASKLDQARFVGMQRQTVLAESLRQRGQHAARVSFRLEEQDEVIGVADQMHVPLQARRDPFDDPCVEHFVQIHVCQQRRNHAALRCARIGIA